MATPAERLSDTIGTAHADATGAEAWDDLARAFAAIGAAPRLRILRLLVRAGAGGLSVGEIGERLGIAASTLAHHLRAMVDGGLIEQRRDGRQTITRARFDRLQALSDFILEECCAEGAGEIDNG